MKIETWHIILIITMVICAIGLVVMAELIDRIFG